MSPLYSHSRLSSFENCPKQFHFRYVLKIPSESEGVEAFVGKRVHEVLERLYVFVGKDMVPGIEKVVARYHTLWDEHFDAERLRIVREGMTFDHYRQLGERCLRNFYRRHYPFDHDETLGLEERVVFSLDEDGRYKMQGIIDRIVRAGDGAIEIHDYKTGQRVPSQRNLDRDRQLALYQIGLQDRYGADQPFRLVWHYVASGQIRSSARTPEELRALREETIGLIDRIEGEQQFAPNRIPLCSWCEYQPICPEWGGDETAANDAAATPESSPTDRARPQLDLL
ncbi:MAG: RecB family exonuclease [Myxococcota bacterium]